MSHIQCWSQLLSPNPHVVFMATPQAVISPCRLDTWSHLTVTLWTLWTWVLHRYLIQTSWFSVRTCCLHYPQCTCLSGNYSKICNRDSARNTWRPHTNPSQPTDDQKVTNSCCDITSGAKRTTESLHHRQTWCHFLLPHNVQIRHKGRFWKKVWEK